MTLTDEQPKRKRIRKRSLRIQLQAALQAAEQLDKEPMNDFTAARMNLAKVRLVTLNKMVLRERNQKMKFLQAEVGRLTVENAKLKRELCVRGASVDCGVTDSQLDAQVEAMMEQLKLAETTEPSVPAPAPTPAPAARHREFDPKIDLAWRRGTAYEPGDSAPRLSPSREEQQAVTDLQCDIRFSQRSVAEKVAKIEQDAARVRAMRDQTI
jgi:hypothetical protein